MIAEKDLEIRGPGDFFGTRQWGMPNFRVGQLMRDRELLERRARGVPRGGRGRSRAGPLRAFLEGGRLGAPLRPGARRLNGPLPLP